jgi:hypothetical protein
MSPKPQPANRGPAIKLHTVALLCRASVSPFLVLWLVNVVLPARLTVPPLLRQRFDEGCAPPRSAATPAAAGARAVSHSASVAGGHTQCGC